MSNILVASLGALVSATSLAAVAAATPECTNQTFPFTYFDVDGNVINGTSNADGICTFSAANCGPDTHIHECCQKNMGAEGFNMNDGGNVLLIGLVATYAQIIWYKMKAQTKEERADTMKNMTPGWVDQMPGLFQRLFKMGIIAFILPMIMVPIYMNKSIQSNLSVSSRNALLGAQAFMDPYRDVFQFIEDVVLIRVSYSLAAGRKKETNNLVHVGILGALVTGLVAAVIGTILGVIPQSLSTLTNPGSANDLATYPTCDLFDYDSSLVLPYWIVTMWGIPGQLLGLVLSGFMFGAHETMTAGWLIGISLSMLPAIWFGGKPGQHIHGLITLLGIAECVSSWVFPILAFVYMASPLGKDLREHTGFKFSFQTAKNILIGKEDEEEEAVPSLSGPDERSALVSQDDGDGDEYCLVADQHQKLAEAPSTKSLFIDGVKVMSIDVMTQLCISIGVYLALVSDASVGYQITALQAALPSVGVAYSFSLGFCFKIWGPKFIVNKDYDTFAKLTWVTVGCAFLLFPIILGGVLPFKEGSAFKYGENACEYAHTEDCVGFFTGVFGENGTGGKFTLVYTWNAICFGACIDVLALTTRAILLTCNDFDYCLKSTVVAVVVYIPAIIVVTISDQPYVNQASSLFIVMYFPQAVLSFLFLVRIFVVLKKMKNGEWDQQQEAVNSSLRSEPGLSKSFKLA